MDFVSLKLQFKIIPYPSILIAPPRFEAVLVVKLELTTVTVVAIVIDPPIGEEPPAKLQLDISELAP